MRLFSRKRVTVPTNPDTLKEPVPPSAENRGNTEKKKTPLPLKVLGILMIASAVLSVPILIIVIVGMVVLPDEVMGELGFDSFLLFGTEIIILLVIGVLGFVFGINLLRNNRRNARRISEVLIVITIGSMLIEIMLYGLTPSLITSLIRLVIYIAVMVYIDPSLSQERSLQRKLRKMETRERAEEGTLGRDETGKGFIELDFFNIFWIFVVASVIGLILEVLYHAVIFGGYQDRAGLLYGPFSPIYGFGAVLMTVALNRFHNKSIIIIFLVSAVIGGAFEFAVSLFMEMAFGITAWDYTGTFLSIDGRTNGMFMAMWGTLGCFWVKLILPNLLRVINLIPWNLRYSLTTICAALMIANGGLTLASLDCWYQREAGNQPQNALEKFCAEYYDDEFMENRFQTMSIDPHATTRTN